MELESTKKLNYLSDEYVLLIKVIFNLLLLIGDLITEQDQIDVILKGLRCWTSDSEHKVAVIYVNLEKWYPNKILDKNRV